MNKLECAAYVRKTELKDKRKKNANSSYRWKENAREQNEREHTCLTKRRKKEFAISKHRRKIKELEVTAREIGCYDSRWERNFSTSEKTETSPFEDLKDNIDAYIQRFEIYAISQKWHNDTCEAHLSALLKGKALSVSPRPSSKTALDFCELKNDRGWLS